MIAEVLASFAILMQTVLALRRRRHLQAALDRVEAQLEEWDRLSKGETPTTARIRAAINGRSTT